MNETTAKVLFFIFLAALLIKSPSCVDFFFTPRYTIHRSALP